MYEYIGPPSPGFSRLELHYQRDRNEAYVLYGAVFPKEYAIFADILTFTTFVVRQLVNLSDPRESTHYDDIVNALRGYATSSNDNQKDLFRVTELGSPPEKSKRSFVAHMTFGYFSFPLDYLPDRSRLYALPAGKTLAAATLDLQLQGFGFRSRKAAPAIATAVRHLLLYFEQRRYDDPTYLGVLHAAAEQCAGLDIKRESARVDERGNIVRSPELFDQPFIASDIAMTCCYGHGVAADNGLLGVLS